MLAILLLHENVSSFPCMADTIQASGNTMGIEKIWYSGFLKTYSLVGGAVNDNKNRNHNGKIIYKC